MGSAKAGLDWHGSTLLRRVTGVLARAVSPGPVVVVGAAGQELPALAHGIEVVCDELPERGPLQGLAAGLAAVDGRAAIAYVSSVDMPLLHPEFVRAVLAGLGAGVDIAVPEVSGRLQPLSAAYRVGVARGEITALLAEDRLAVHALLDRCRVRRLTEGELPAPESLTNLNSREDYERALALPAPSVRVDGSLRRAWTLGEVVTDAGAVTLNGGPVASDPELPLVAGDTVAYG